MEHVNGYPHWSLKQAANLTAADIFPEDEDAEALLFEALWRGYKPEYPEDYDIGSGNILGLIRTTELRECALECQRRIEAYCGTELDLSLIHI